MRTNLLSAWRGLITQDIDLIAFDNNLNSFILIEEKNKPYAPISISQAICFKMLDELLNLQIQCHYCGSYLIYYIKESTNDEKIWINPPLVRGREFSYKMGNTDNISSLDKKGLTNLIYNSSGFSHLEHTYRNNWYQDVVNAFVNKLWDCGEIPPYEGTKKERSMYRNSYIYEPSENMKNINWIFINYCTGYFILIEEKQDSDGNYMPNSDESQMMDKIHKIFIDANNTNLSLSDNEKVKNPRSKKPYEYLGYFLLEFEGKGPEDSDNIYLNHQKITKEDLITFLNLNSQSSKQIAKNYMHKWW